MNPKSDFKNSRNGNFHKLLALRAAALLIGLAVVNSKAQFSDADWVSLGAGVNNTV